MTYADDRKPARSRLRVGLATVLFVIYLAFVMWVTMSPSLDGVGVDSVADRVLRVLQRIGVPDSYGYMQLEFTANIGMFVPLGFLLGLALPGWGWWLALILLPAYSFGIEWFQGEFLADRVSDMRGIVSNSIGAWIGTLAAAFLRALVHARDAKVIARAIWDDHREARVSRAPQPDPRGGAAAGSYVRGPHQAGGQDPYRGNTPFADSYLPAPPTAHLPAPQYPAPREPQRPFDPNATEVLSDLGFDPDRTPTAPTQIFPR